MRDDVLKWLAAHEGEMLKCLEEAVNIDSCSRDVAGIDKVGRLFSDQLQSSGIRLDALPCEGYGNCLRADVWPVTQAKPDFVVLLGHMDTVFPAGTVGRRPYRVEGGRAYGPGVADMKAGLVMNTFVARAFAETGFQVPLRVFYSCDEEIASPASRDHILGAVRGAKAVLNAEPGRITGNVVTCRNGAFFIDFEVTGVSAHSGGNHSQGASAIEALARKILEIHDVTDYGAGVTANVGTIAGGTSVNTVAPSASAQLDVRFPEKVDADVLFQRFRDIIESESIPRTKGKITRIGTFRPLAETEASRRLFSSYRYEAQKVGFDVQAEFSGGSADSGLTAWAGVPTLCATGPVGGYPHTEREYCDLSTLVPRAQTVAATVIAQLHH